MTALHSVITGLERREDAWHGTGGPLAVSDLRHRNPLSQVFLDAARAGKKFLSIPLFDGTSATGAQDTSVAIFSWDAPAQNPHGALPPTECHARPSTETMTHCNRKCPSRRRCPSQRHDQLRRPHRCPRRPPRL